MNPTRNRLVAVCAAVLLAGLAAPSLAGLHLSTAEVCAYDKVEVNVTVPRAFTPEQLDASASQRCRPFVGLISAGSSELRAKLALKFVTAVGNASDPDGDDPVAESVRAEKTDLKSDRDGADASVLGCAVDEEFCEVELRAAQVDDSPVEGEDGAKTYETSLVFSVDTDTPKVDYAEDVLRIVTPTGPWGVVHGGRWLDARTLLLRHTVSKELREEEAARRHHDGGDEDHSDDDDAFWASLRVGLVMRKDVDDDAVDITANDLTELVEASTALRIGDPGSYAVQLCLPRECRLGQEADRVFSGADTVDNCVLVDDGSQELLVRQCDTAAVVPPTALSLHQSVWTKSSRGSQRGSKGRGSPVVDATPTPALNVAGTMAMSPKDMFSLREEYVPSSGEVGWAFSMWLWMEQAGTGEYRTLFYTGNGDGRRTPSAWLSPDSGKLLLRASVDGNWDIGVDSVGELPERRWVHVAFSFTNDTFVRERIEDEQKQHRASSGDCNVDGNESCPSADAAVASDADGIEYINEQGDDISEELLAAGTQNMPDEVQYRFRFFVDGVLDTQASFKQVVIPSNGTFHLGKDPTYSGFSGLISDFRIYHTPLTDGAVLAEYQRSAGTVSTEGPAACDVSALDVDVRELCRHVAPAVQAARIAEAWKNGRPAVGTTMYHPTEGDRYSEYELVKMTEEAEAAMDGCDDDLIAALDLLETAAAAGHLPAMRKAAMLLLFPERRIAEGDVVCWQNAEGISRDPVRARQLLERAASAGDADAILELAYLTSAGVGSFEAPDAATLLSAVDSSPAAEGEGGDGVEEPAMETSSNDVADAAEGHLASYAVAGRVADTGDGLLHGRVSVTGLALYHLAAMAGNAEAALVLGHAYSRGRGGLPADEETAAWYYLRAVDTAYAQFHTPGHQPLNEMERLTEDNEDTIADGQRGEDDEQIQYQMLRADQGDADAQLAMGDLYYWGAHGLPRDQARAFDYFQRAADQGNARAQVALGNMYLKGEGVAASNVSALLWYNKAIQHDPPPVRALNGLGFAYFYGRGVEKNLTKAFEYFTRAAEAKEDGDSSFNAGMCLAEGLGVERNLTAALELFDYAAKSHGHFDSIRETGLYHAGGIGTKRDPVTALKYLRPASLGGSWGGDVRDGFELFLHGDNDGAALKYLRAMEMGYETGSANVGYLLDRGKASFRELVGAPQRCAQCQLVAARMAYETSLAEGGLDSALKLGDYHYYGLGGLPRSPAVAARLYSRASAAGSAQAAFNLAIMNEYGWASEGDGGAAALPSPGTSDQASSRGGGRANPPRAAHYYRRAMELNPDSAGVPVQLALARMKVRSKLLSWGVPEWVLRATRLLPADDVVSRGPPVSSGLEPASDEDKVAGDRDMSDAALDHVLAAHDDSDLDDPHSSAPGTIAATLAWAVAAFGLTSEADIENAEVVVVLLATALLWLALFVRWARRRHAAEPSGGPPRAADARPRRDSAPRAAPPARGGGQAGTGGDSSGTSRASTGRSDRASERRSAAAGTGDAAGRESPVDESHPDGGRGGDAAEAAINELLSTVPQGGNEARAAAASSAAAAHGSSGGGGGGVSAAAKAALQSQRGGAEESKGGETEPLD